MISVVGVPIELFGAITHRNAIDDVLCKSIAFTHTLLGKDGKPIRALNPVMIFIIRPMSFYNSLFCYFKFKA